MRTAALLATMLIALGGVAPLHACLNDRSVIEYEEDFRGQYEGEPAPEVDEAPAAPTALAGFGIATGLLLALAALGLEIQRRHGLATRRR